jgi:DNA polymerase V
MRTGFCTSPPHSRRGGPQHNDGCAIARTAEAKAAGIKMGDPGTWFKPTCRSGSRRRMVLLELQLYGDMSRRMYEVLTRHVPRVEPYSIDEMFLDMDVPRNAADLARELRDTVRRIAKLPTCVGIGPTKTIAKLANALAKDQPS